VIPDGNPVGILCTGLVNGMPTTGSAAGTLTVQLTVSGGYNGDLFSYLVAPNGTRVNLLSRPGVGSGNPFGFGGSGLNVTLLDSASASIQTSFEAAGVQVVGDFQAQGSLAGFYGAPANGTWSLYFADLSAGGGQAMLNEWSLGIEAVPEPVNVALALFGVLFVVARTVRFWRNRPSSTGPQV
jgi:subtilisin-like proprotein convertase family protein